ncbi:MAG: hypothetical protein NTW95_01255 [Candidatus Aminicenantes bacterium]|nr:hypothetical protein [Candidatus Aminicenantes bacterium]
MFAVLELIGFINIVGVVLYQFMLVPSLATEIKSRFQELGQPIKLGFFWDRDYLYFKAKRLNRDLQDPIISRLLKELKGFIIYSIFSFVFLAVTVILDGILNK